MPNTTKKLVRIITTTESHVTHFYDHLLQDHREDVDSFCRKHSVCDVEELERPSFLARTNPFSTLIFKTKITYYAE